jgi:hypothetical protein
MAVWTSATNAPYVNAAAAMRAGGRLEELAPPTAEITANVADDVDVVEEEVVVLGGAPKAWVVSMSSVHQITLECKHAHRTRCLAGWM